MTKSLARANNWEAIAHNPWMGILLFGILAIILIIGGIIGFKRGLYAGFYMLGMNLVGFLIAIFVAPLFSQLSLSKKLDTNYQEAQALMPILNGFYMLLILLCWIIVSEIIYAIIAKWLSVPLQKRINKNEGVKTLRGLGAAITVVATYPLAILATSAAGFVANDNVISKINNKVVRGLTLNKAKGTGESVDGLIAKNKYKADTELVKSIDEFLAQIKGTERNVYSFNSNTLTYTIDVSKIKADKMNNFFELLTSGDTSYKYINVLLADKLKDALVYSKVSTVKEWTEKDYVKVDVKVINGKDKIFKLKNKAAYDELKKNIFANYLDIADAKDDVYLAEDSKKVEAWQNSTIEDKKRYILDVVFDGWFDYKK